MPVCLFCREGVELDMCPMVVVDNLNAAIDKQLSNNYCSTGNQIH